MNEAWTTRIGPGGKKTSKQLPSNYPYITAEQVLAELRAEEQKKEEEKLRVVVDGNLDMMYAWLATVDSSQSSPYARTFNMGPSGYAYLNPMSYPGNVSGSWQFQDGQTGNKRTLTINIPGSHIDNPSPVQRQAFDGTNEAFNGAGGAQWIDGHWQKSG